MAKSESVKSPMGFAWELGAACFCFLFGLAMILNVHPSGDGLWFFYGSAMREHLHLYADLHLNQQPLFVELTALSQKMFGLSWLASKILAALQLLAYCVALFLVSCFIPWQGWRRALVLLAAFFMAIAPMLSRFDDYHITTQCFEIYSLYLLLLLWKKPGVNRGLITAVAIGVLSGLSLSDRLNDGAALFLGCAMALFFLAPAKRWLALFLLAAATGLTLLGVVKSTSDALSIWFLETVTHAAKIKGGTGSILTGPALFPFRLVTSGMGIAGIAVFVAVAIIFYLFHRYPDAFQKGHRFSSREDILIAGYLVLVSAALLTRTLNGAALTRLAQSGLLLLVVFGVWVMALMIRQLLRPSSNGWRSISAVLLIAFWGPFSTAMSAGIAINGYEPDVALLILIAPFALPFTLHRQALRRGFLVVAALVVLVSLPFKARIPYSWHHFHAARMFKNRVWYQHPVYGPMVIERNQLQFIAPLCETIRTSGTPQELLSLPYPYANYFCGIKPWHGYVQTWFDTSSQQRIEALDQELLKKPPEWIVYQRELDTLSIHEHTYSGDRELPHRGLDKEIMQEIATGHWTMIRRNCLDGADWILIRTTPPEGNEYRASEADSADRSAMCVKATAKGH